MIASAPIEAVDYDFVLPARLKARVPPEARGLERDEIRMLVAFRDSAKLEHVLLRDLTAYLAPPDLVVINTSATIPAALEATLGDGTAALLHVSTRLPGDVWAVEVRDSSGSQWKGQPQPLAPGSMLLPEGGRADLLAPYGGERLWLATLDLPAPVLEYLARNGSPIRYDHEDQDLPLDAYQTVYSTEPGSAEMPSAGRGFTTKLITDLVARGVGVAPLVLHTGVSSLESDERPYPELFRVPPETARRVNAAKEADGRVIAVGTTVVRALETVTDDLGVAHSGSGWTELVITPERGVRVVDGLLTGWHEPRASHLSVVEAVSGLDLLDASYRAALAGGYLWHEFGDVQLILPFAPA